MVVGFAGNEWQRDRGPLLLPQARMPSTFVRPGRILLSWVSGVWGASSEKTFLHLRQGYILPLGTDLLDLHDLPQWILVQKPTSHILDSTLPIDDQRPVYEVALIALYL